MDCIHFETAFALIKTQSTDQQTKTLRQITDLVQSCISEINIIV